MENGGNQLKIGNHLRHCCLCRVLSSSHYYIANVYFHFGNDTFMLQYMKRNIFTLLHVNQDIPTIVELMRKREDVEMEIWSGEFFFSEVVASYHSLPCVDQRDNCVDKPTDCQREVINIEDRPRRGVFN